jgi:hypothetical protein
MRLSRRFFFLAPMVPDALIDLPLRLALVPRRPTYAWPCPTSARNDAVFSEERASTLE